MDSNQLTVQKGFTVLRASPTAPFPHVLTIYIYLIAVKWYCLPTGIDPVLRVPQTLVLPLH